MFYRIPEGNRTAMGTRQQQVHVEIAGGKHIEFGHGSNPLR
jgi:hypothetical protein